MKYRYYVTDSVRKWWTKQNLGPVFQKKLSEFENSTSEIKQSEELSYGVVLTRFKGISGRPTFAWMYRSKDDAFVYVLRAAYNHDAYDTEMKGSAKLQAWAEKNQLTQSEEDEVSSLLEKMLEIIPEVKVPKPTLSGPERDFLSGQLEINQVLFKDAIYETKTWVDYVQSKGSKGFDFFAAAGEIEEHIINNVSSQDGWQQILWDENVIFLYHKGLNWILDNVYPLSDETDFDKLINLPEPTDFRRGYPFSYLDNKDDWHRMELEKKSNMVLSEDQVAIVSEKIDYPLFITGRAGSGKSTILQYLFAEIILRYISHKTSGSSTLLPPVYLSYSENLIQDAKGLSQLLLERNSCYKKMSKHLGVTFEKNINPEFDDMFFVFQTLVKSCIKKYEPEYLQKHFNNSQYISFADFNSKWQLKFGSSKDANKKYSPSLSWHVIRTYIKGWDSSKLMSPEDYCNLPKDRKTVSDETYSLVYDKVWCNWYSKLDNVWDDQDLVRFCLDKGYVKEMYSGIFCDEAQDFTRVELDFILKLSCFANRTIEDAADIKTLPFVFAGDEFQTLNPTGFSWDSLRGYFANRLCEFSGLSEKNIQVRIAGEIELSENFRSTRQVVKLANHIQLLRATRFNASSKPQSPHFSQEGSPIVCLSPSDKNVFDKLRSMEIVLIVPAADGVSACEYIKNSPLKDMVEIVDGTPQGITILNPTQAKGLEYPNVAVYGFDCEGALSSLGINALTKWYENPIDNPEADIELKYQLSNAYVAVTRASNKLFIIDNFDIDSFWAFAYAHPEYNNTLITPLKDSMLKSLSPEKRRQWSDSLLGWINPGSVNNITSENVDYMKSEENRMALEKRAESLRDSELMKQAACRNKEAGRKKDEDRCWAKAYSFDEQYLKAAELFVAASLVSDAVDNYWQALKVELANNTIVEDECQNIITKIAHLKNDIKSIKVLSCFYYMQKVVLLRDLKIILDDLLVYISNSDDYDSIIWNFLLDSILSKILSNKKCASDVRVIIEQRAKLFEYDIEMSADKMAKIALNASCINDALSLWEELSEEERPDVYFIEKANQTHYPERIMYLISTKLEDKEERIWVDYKKNGRNGLTELDKMLLGRFFMNRVKDQRIKIEPKSSDAEEMSFLLPSILLYSQDYEYLRACQAIAKEGFGLSLGNEVILNSFNDLRFDKTSSLANLSLLQFKDNRAQKAANSLVFIEKIRNTDFVKRVIGKYEANEEKIIMLCKSLRSYSHQALTPYVIYEIGKVVEARGFYNESLLFYDNARSLGDGKEYQAMIDSRRWYFMEVLAAQGNKSMKSKAVELNKQFGFDENNLSQYAELDVTLPIMIKIYKDILDMNGELLMQNADSKKTVEVLKETPTESENMVDNRTLSNSKEEKSQLTLFDETDEPSTVSMEESTEDEKNSNSETEQIPIRASSEAPRQEFMFDGYKFTYIPQKNELIIKFEHEDDDFTMKVKNGEFRSSDFHLAQGGRLMNDRDEPTPFVLSLSISQQVVLVMKDEIFTGVSFVFVAS